MQHAEYLVSDRLWYDVLENLADDKSRFSSTDISPPHGWVRGQFDGWVGWQPKDLELPSQGWKVHVSARISEANEIIGIVGEYCVSRRLAFKFLRSRLVCLVRNEKYASRAGSGKLITIYPVGDIELERTLRELSAALAGRCGPYILSDLRWGSGPLYIRYGGFLLRHCVSPESGEFVAAVREPDGSLVPDVRAPVFRVPTWAPVPGFVAAQIEAAARQPASKLPYKIEHALHFSNGGGIYRAIDPATNRIVVIREARPDAGLDANENDAVSRLAREREMLVRLADLDCAPTLLGQFTRWEHHYLVEEYIEGQVLQHAIASRYPLVYPDPPAHEIAEYARWALTVIHEIECALDSVHRRGIVFGDLHPFNVILRPDGRIALVDFEESRDISEQRPGGLGAPGFVPAWPVQGVAADEYAMACVRLAFFLPLTPLLGLDPGKARYLVRVAAQRFRLPPVFRNRLAAGLSPPAQWDQHAWLARRPGLCHAADAGIMSGTGADTAEPDPPALLASMAAAITASATPDRDDRLFPGDPRQFAEGGVSLAHGAAGVLYALATAGSPVLPEHADWLARAALRWRPPLPGAYSGLDGVAVVLAMLGRREDSLEVASRASANRCQIRRAGLYDGLAGAGLALLNLADATGEQVLAEEAVHIGDTLAAALTDGRAAAVVAPRRAGLMDGWTGVAAFFLGLYERTREPSCLDMAEAALRLDLARCVSTKTGGLQVDDGPRLTLYLATGSSGIALVIQALLVHRPGSEFAAARERIRTDLGVEFIMFPGLFEGRAGIMLASAALADDASAGQNTGRPAGNPTDSHLRRLAWHALSYQGHTAFPGNGLHRLSMDLATGTAGVLLATCAATPGGMTTLPLLDAGCFARRLPAASAG